MPTMSGITSVSSIRIEFGADANGEEQLLIIHTDRNGEVSKRDVEAARDTARRVDEGTSRINAIVSVLMLREGWDVQNVTVIVGLRPYTSKANILPEQTIGRGLRLMFADHATTYIERVDVIGNTAFLKFVEQLERDEEITLDSFDLKEKLVITTSRSTLRSSIATSPCRCSAQSWRARRRSPRRSPASTSQR